MYKKFLLVSVFVFLIILIPKISFANSIYLKSLSKTVEPGKNFNLSVYVDSSTSQSYTVQANIDFPADLVSVESFTYAGSWMPLEKMAGYDLIDNNTGKLIKTAGYPNGFNKEVLMGTLVLKAKKAGSINIVTNKSSYVLDMDSNDTLTNRGSFSINSLAPVVVPPPVVKPPVEKPQKPVTPPVKEPEIKKPVKTETVKPKVEEIPEVETTEEKTTLNEETQKRSFFNNIILLFNGALTIGQFFNIIL